MHLYIVCRMVQPGIHNVSARLFVRERNRKYACSCSYISGSFLSSSSPSLISWTASAIDTSGFIVNQVVL